MQLRWKASFSATCLYAASCLSKGMHVNDAQLAADLKPAIDSLLNEINAAGLSDSLTLPLLVNLASEQENNRQLVELAIRKLHGANAIGHESVTRLAGCISDLESAMLRSRPGLVEELAVRGRPLREQWEARGPGLLKTMARIIGEENFLPTAAEITLVTPLVGGHGLAHLQSNRVTFEAVLANPHAELPEVLRLGWLLGQLNLDLPCFSESIPGSRLGYVAGLAVVPLVLTAAKEVELISKESDLLTQTLECWHLPVETNQCLHDWWQTFYEGEVRWTVALAGLNAML